MIVKLLPEHHFEFLSLKGGYTGSFESTFVKIPHCWKSHVMAHMFWCIIFGRVFGLLKVMIVRAESTCMPKT